MIDSIKSILHSLVSLIEKLTSISTQRLLIFALLIYPIILIVTYKEEVLLIITAKSASTNVQFSNLPDVQYRCVDLRKKYGAEAVMIYLYQPSSIRKNYKERVVISTSEYYVPIKAEQNIQLSSRSRIIEELKTNNSAFITDSSGHHESAIVRAFKLDHILITPIKDIVTEQIIGEVVWVFRNPHEIDLDTFVQEGQIFAYDIPSLN